jgi:hypothetical protein
VDSKSKAIQKSGIMRVLDEKGKEKGSEYGRKWQERI